MTENEISKIVLDASIKVHKALGPGLLESPNQACLAYELKKRNLLVEIEKPLPLIYDKVEMEVGYRVDILVEKKVILEIKSVKKLDEIHLAQILSYLKLSNTKLGLLINFNVTFLKNGFKRVVHKL